MDGVRLVEIHQRFEAPRVSNLTGRVREEVGGLLERWRSEPGSRVGITAGSRGIGEATTIYRAAVEAVREAGHTPFLFASMGSHGRGTAAGQRDLLNSLGVAEEEVGAPVLCSEEAVQLGETVAPVPDLPVYAAREATQADGILVVNRVKPHTSFHGAHESGLMKMLAVGMGRAKGASMVHRLGWSSMVEAIRSIGGAVLERLPVIGGLAVVENARKETALVRGLPASDIPREETRLLELARRYMPRLHVDDLDLCVVREMGKNYSGTGMDTNIIGRLRLEGIPEPERPAIRYLGVLDLSGASHGNATGVGLADFTTERLASSVDREATYLNCLTSGCPIRAAIPMTLPTDRALFKAAWQALKPERADRVRLAVIDNTLQLERMWISEALVPEIKGREEIGIAGEPASLAFDAGERLLIPQEFPASTPPEFGGGTSLNHTKQSNDTGPRGVFAATLTPMDEELRPDNKAFAAHCRRLLESGCHGVSVFGTTGEANSLSVEERISALEALAGENLPGESLLPGTGACSLTDAVRLSRAALELGASSVLVLPPFYYKGVSDEGIFRFFAKLIERVGDDRLRIYLYHIPQMSGVGFSVPLIGRLIDAYPGVVVGTKDSAGDWRRIKKLCHEFPGFSVFPGTERYLLDALQQGGTGCISATVNVTSRLARRVYDAQVAGREQEALGLQERLTEIREAIEAYPTIPALKGLMRELTGKESWHNLRPPLVALGDGERRNLLASLPPDELL